MSNILILVSIYFSHKEEKKKEQLGRREEKRTVRYGRS